MTNRPSERAYWRSLDELADTPEFRDLVSREFPTMLPDILSASGRRTFLKLMGASLALAGLAGCRWPREAILPFAKRPDGFTPGEPIEYATALDVAGHALGVLATSYDGRPIKVDGNPSHSLTAGKSDPWLQAAILELYDPDRSRVLLQRDGSETVQPPWSSFESTVAEWRETWAATGGTGVRFLSEATGSPSVRRLRDEFLREFPNAVWYEYEAVSRDNEREGLMAAYGRPLRPQLALERAELVVTLDAELMAEHPAALRNQRGIAAGRRTADDGHMNRLIAVEGRYSLTGAMADHRYAVPSSGVAHVAMALAARVAATLRGVRVPAVLSRLAGDAHGYACVEAIAGQLLEHRDKAVVIAGASQPPAVHAVVAWLNEAIGALASGVLSYTPDLDPERPSHTQALRQLASEAAAGEIDTLFVFGGNPVYDAPADVDVAALLGNVKTSVHLGLYQDETAGLCTWHLPRAHALESWGDGVAWDGTISIVQPLIEPLHGGRSVVEVMSILTGHEPPKGYEIVRETMRTWIGGEPGFEGAWRTALRDGVIGANLFGTAPVQGVGGASVNEVLSRWQLPGLPADGALELIVFPDRKLRDGRFANNAWLQELPDPITKLTWGNAAEIGLTTAGELGVQTGDLVELTVGERTVRVPVFVEPGQAPGTVALAAGYGREAAGQVGNGVGRNAFSVMEGAVIGSVGGLVVRPTGQKEKIANTQNHFAIDKLGRDETASRAEELLRDADLSENVEHPDWVQHRAHEAKKLFQLWKEWEYDGHAWGMTVDLNVCTGCSACVVACQSENNIPVVGREQVHNGREMHWIRVDRYYKGVPEEAQVGFQPVACQHCETAPCEQVCPVAATVHDDEGLNVMVYNRCVGTRYCSNNCPYKVRRFNFFNYNKNVTELEAVRHNPEVTVRARGVMEKCTFCTQRIERAKIDARNANRPLQDGEITPACAQACPVDAIVFGDLNDETSRVRKLYDHQRAYGLLAGLNTRPRVHYLGKVRNPAGGSESHESGSGEHA